MFLLVFVTLLISVVDLYAQVVSVQTARIYSHQTALAQLISAWHASAVDLAVQNPVLPVNIGSGLTGCLMTNVADSAMPARCSAPAETFDPYSNLARVGYANMPYTFMSEMYLSDSGGSPAVYVLTFVYAQDGQGELIVPNAAGTTLGYSLGDLARQMVNATAISPTTAYGRVVYTGSPPQKTLIPHIINASNMPYNFAVPDSVPLNAFGLISSAR